MNEGPNTSQNNMNGEYDKRDEEGTRNMTVTLEPWPKSINRQLSVQAFASSTCH